MNIVADIGNTATKLGLFEGKALKEVRYGMSFEEMTAYCRQFDQPDILISSVQKNNLDSPGNIHPAARVYVLSADTPLPITNSYHTPHTLGSDRLAAAAACHALYPGSNCLSIDAGTCITYDYINAKGEYLGGAISPGPLMRLEAMHRFTGRLPLLSPDFESEVLMGHDTASCMMAGALRAMLCEVDAMIAAYSSQFPVDHVLICGGHTSYFVSGLKAPIFASPHLVLIGLNAILLHNVS